MNSCLNNERQTYVLNLKNCNQLTHNLQERLCTYSYQVQIMNVLDNYSNIIRAYQIFQKRQTLYFDYEQEVSYFSIFFQFTNSIFLQFREFMTISLCAPDLKDTQEAFSECWIRSLSFNNSCKQLRKVNENFLIISYHQINVYRLIWVIKLLQICLKPNKDKQFSMQLTYIPIQGFQFYCIPQCKYVQLISRSKNPVYLYQHRNSREHLVVKEIPFDKNKIKIYSIIKDVQQFESIVRIRGMCILCMQDKRQAQTGKQNLRQKNTIKNKPKALRHDDDSQFQIYNEVSNQSIFIQKGTYGSPSQVYIQGQPFDNNHAQEAGLQSKSQNQTSEQKKSLLIWMEYYRHNMPSITRERRSKRKSFTKEQAADFLLQMVTVLQALQRKGLAHRDIKPQNILYSQQKKYKLCDFDEAIIVDQKTLLNSYKQDGLNQILQPTTFAYCSPSFLQKIYNRKQGFKDEKYFCPFKLDVYALGLTFLYFCSMGRFQVQDRLNFVQNKSVHQQFMRQQRRKYVKQNPVYEGFNVILKTMLEEDQYKRDDFIILMIKIRNGMGGLLSLIENRKVQLQSEVQSFRENLIGDQYAHRSQEDLSDVMSRNTRQKNLLLKSKRNKNTTLGTNKAQGRLLAGLIFIVMIAYTLLLIF